MIYNRQTDIGFDIDFMLNLMQEVKRFADSKPEYKCYITDMDSMMPDPKDEEKRVDIWLLFQKEEAREGITYVSDGFLQKVFLINGKLMDCDEYRELLAVKERT